MPVTERVSDTTCAETPRAAPSDRVTLSSSARIVVGLGERGKLRRLGDVGLRGTLSVYHPDPALASLGPARASDRSSSWIRRQHCDVEVGNEAELSRCGAGRPAALAHAFMSPPSATDCSYDRCR